jgi:hypothetical protein
LAPFPRSKGIEPCRLESWIEVDPAPRVLGGVRRDAFPKNSLPPFAEPRFDRSTGNHGGRLTDGRGFFPQRLIDILGEWQMEVPGRASHDAISPAISLWHPGTDVKALRVARYVPESAQSASRSGAPWPPPTSPTWARTSAEAGADVLQYATPPDARFVRLEIGAARSTLPMAITVDIDSLR